MIFTPPYKLIFSDISMFPAFFLTVHIHLLFHKKIWDGAAGGGELASKSEEVQVQVGGLSI